MTNPMVQNYLFARMNNLSAAQNNEKQTLHPIVKKDITTASAAKGHLIDENILESAGSNIKAYADSVKFLADGVSGKGTDYTTGRINDLTTRLGSLGIAGVLAAGAGSPFKKGMEFVGFASWFGAMAAWPKVIGTPLKALTGVDINQQYSDSFGRKKAFFEDPQYICWDIISDEHINKVGDKLNIPKNIENRREAVQEKMKQIATQGNTLSMLTAGFATPIIASLVADQLQKPFGDALEKVRLSKAEKGLANIESAELMSTDKKGLQQLDALLGDSENIDTKSLKQVETFMAEKFKGTGIEGELSKQLNAIANPANAKVLLDDSVKSKLQTALGLDAKGFTAVFGEEKELNAADMPKFSRKVRAHIAKTNSVSPKDLESMTKSAVADMQKVISENQQISVEPAKIRSLFGVADDFVAKKQLVNNYLKVTIGDIADSQTAKNWGKNPQAVLNALGIKGKLAHDIAKGKGDVEQIIVKHLDDLAGDSEKFSQAMLSLQKVTESQVQSEQKAAAVLIKNLRKLSAKSVKNARDNGFDILGQVFKNDCKIEQVKISDKVMNTKSSLFKVFNVLGAFKSGAEDSVKKALVSHSGIDNFTNKLEEFGVKTKDQFKIMMDKVFTPANLDMSDSLAKANARHSNKLKKSLSAIANAIRPDMTVGKTAIPTNSLAQHVGKSFKNLVVDAAQNGGIYKTWLKRVGGAGVALTGVTMLAITQFGKTNNYNPDVYKVKEGDKNAG